MSSLNVSEIVDQYKAICDTVPLYPIHSKDEYEKAISVLNDLLDAGGADESHPLARLVETLGCFIEDYEKIHHPFDERPH